MKLIRTKKQMITGMMLSMLTVFTISCGGAPSNSGTGNHALSNAPDWYSFTDSEGNVITQAGDQDTVMVRNDASGLTLMSLKIDGPVDLSNLTAIINASIFLAHFNDDASKNNISSLTAYVPCLDESVTVCPGVVDAANATRDCANKIELTGNEPTDSGYTLDGRIDSVCQVTADVDTFGTAIMGSTAQVEDLSGPFKTCSFALPFPPPTCGPTLCGAGTFVPDTSVGMNGPIMTIGLDSCNGSQITCKVPCSEAALCGVYNVNQTAFEGTDPDESQCDAVAANPIQKPDFECPPINTVTIDDYQDPDDYDEPDAEYWCIMRIGASDYDPPEVNFFVTPDSHGPFPWATMDPLDSVDNPGFAAAWETGPNCSYIHNHDMTVEGHLDTLSWSCGHGGLILLDKDGNIL